MFNDFFNLNPVIKEEGSFYTISGVNFHKFEFDLKKVYGTTVISNRILNRKSSSSFRVHKFFLVELAWLLDNLVNQNNSYRRYYKNKVSVYISLLETLKKESWIKSTYQTFPQFNIEKALALTTVKPFPEQREFLEGYSNVKYGFHLRGSLLDAAAGSGKTLTSIWWSKSISDGPTIILAPQNLINKPWIDHLDPEGENYYFKKPPKYWTSLDKTSPLDVKAEYYIFYTENMRNDNWNGIPFNTILKSITDNGKNKAKLIIDESHRYNNYKSQQTVGTVEFASNPLISDVLAMSGTPIKAQGKETYPLFCIIDKYFDRFVREDFLKMYGRDNYTLNEMLAHRLGRIKFTINTINGMANPPEPELLKVKFPGVERFTLNNIRIEMMAYIQERVEYYKKELPNYLYDFDMYLREYENSILNDKEALSELNKYKAIVSYFRTNGYNNFTDSDKSKYCKEIEKNIESSLKGEDLKYFRHICPAIKYLGLKIRGEALGNVLGKARIEAVKAAIEHSGLTEIIGTGLKKTAIYSSYIDGINYCYDYLKENGFNPIKLHSGSTDSVKDAVNNFAKVKELNPLITSFDTLGEGVPLLMANQLVILNSPWRSYQLKQVIARIYRKGQDTECFVWMIDLDTGSEENVTSRSIDIMEWSKEQVEQLLNNAFSKNNQLPVSIKAIGSDVTIDDLNIINTLFSFVRPKFKQDTFSSMFR